MSHGSVPEDRTSGLTGGPEPDDAPDADAAPGADGPDAEHHAPRRRLQALAGITVRGSDEKPVGRVRDIYQRDAGDDLAALSVVPRQLSSRAVLIPVAAIASLPTPGEESREKGKGEAIHLLVDTATAKAGKRPPDTGHLTPQDLRDAAEALGLDPDDGTRLLDPDGGTASLDPDSAAESGTSRPDHADAASRPDHGDAAGGSAHADAAGGSATPERPAAG
ncbi:hypothetical protein [Brachybacterium aquaticum]|uniref:PRC-barrel domain-containing protein n=1 Tax=Brachybacterium aquaticum TaxID=1432564 RepID=A0A841A524_9MICO|nr:hypothetical protein [Brachybacterium aquaticum]MBB5830229.1 hypothetical protein [Brachybacterium aquaticum]